MIVVAKDAEDDTSKICCYEHETGLQKVIEHHGMEPWVEWGLKMDFVHCGLQDFRWR